MASSIPAFASRSSARAAERRHAPAFPRRLLGNQAAAIGLTIVAVYILLALTADWLPLRSPVQIVGSDRMAGPSWSLPLGADTFGRDLLSRIVFGAQLSLRVAVLSVAVALLLLALGVVAALGPSANNVVIAIAIVYTPIFARVVRGPVLAIKEREFVEAARALGARASRIIVVHVLPNLLSVLIVQTSIALSWAVLTEASLSFLGLSAQPPAASWGVMLNEGRQNLELAPHLAIFPGLAIMLAVLGFNLLGDGLRDVLDPRLRR